MSPRIAYSLKELPAAHGPIVARANAILRDYAAQGFDLTLRQLYYQFVAHDHFPDDRTWTRLDTGRWVRDPEGTKNADPNYKWLGGIVNDARMAGLIDWHYIVDRTRNLRCLSAWDGPTELVEAAAEQFRMDLWAGQPSYVEVWIEKDALVGVIEGPCERLRVPYFSCRGYTSQSEMWSAAQRLGAKLGEGREVKILHLGDHDPSGIDMSRDIEGRLENFMMTDVDFEPGAFTLDRIALTMDQVREFDPPPNPAKLSDSRGAGYVQHYGYESWELDALSPATLAGLIGDAVSEVVDADAWAVSQAAETKAKEELGSIVENWAEITEQWGSR